MLKNIVLAFDGSEYSNRALKYAKTFAERFEATLWLVHIFSHTSDLLGYEDYEKFTLSANPADKLFLMRYFKN